MGDYPPAAGDFPSTLQAILLSSPRHMQRGAVTVEWPWAAQGPAELPSPQLSGLLKKHSDPLTGRWPGACAMHVVTQQRAPLDRPGQAQPRAEDKPGAR